MKSKKTVITSERIQGLFTEIGKLITSSLEIPKTVGAIMKQVNLFFQPRNWSLLRVDPETQELFFVVAKGIDIKQLENIRLNIGEGVAGYVAKTGKPMLVKNAERSPYFSKKVDKLTGFKTKSVIAVPIIFRQKVLGIIELVNALEDRIFTNRELNILKTIADFSAIALTHAMAYEKMSWLATHDPLTGLYNLEYLNELLESTNKVTPNHKKSDSNYAIAAWIDINDLKEINDCYGHNVGNKVLVSTAELLKHCADKNASVTRFGGDEFIITMMNLKKHDLQKTITHLHKQLKSYSQQIAPSAGFSFGIASGNKKNLSQIILEADRLMYKKKRQLARHH